MDGIAQLAPPIERRLESEHFRALDGAIERDPCHDLRRHVMRAIAAPLPDAVVRLVPYFRQMFEHLAFEVPGSVIQLQLGHPRLMKCVDQFAVDVELQLGMRGIADPDRLRALVTGQPARLPFEQAALAHDAVHDLHAGRRPRHRAQQPIVPARRFLGIARVHQRQQREGGVAQPAEAIIPVSGAAELFRQRRGRRRDDAAGRRIGQRLQRDQRAHHQIAALAVIAATAAPFDPEILGFLQRLRRIDRPGHRQMRRPVGEHKRNRLALAHLEVGYRGHVLAAGLDRRSQHGHVRSANREQSRAILGSS